MSSSAAIESADDMAARHRKELKALDGEKRAALKKTKTTAGKSKKAKEMLAAVESEYDEKLKLMEARHKDELASATTVEEKVSLEEENGGAGAPAPAATEGAGEDDENENDTEDQRRLKKLNKARKKREKQREKEKQKEEEIAAENAAAGPSRRDVEVQQILSVLERQNLSIQEITADGHCLYRAVAAAHLGNAEQYLQIRNLCAEALKSHEEDFAPFCEYHDEDDNDFAAYVNTVRNSSAWGGHLELRAIATAIGRPVVVYSAQQAASSSSPLTIEPIPDTDSVTTTTTAVEPIRLSYHLHYYSLGEHYNVVVPLIAAAGENL